MTAVENIPQPQTEPGVATAEDGYVILDGPDGLAVTMTAAAATLTGQSSSMQPALRKHSWRIAHHRMSKPVGIRNDTAVRDPL